MDIRKLVEALRATLVPDQREQAEAYLKEVIKFCRNFAPCFRSSGKIWPTVDVLLLLLKIGFWYCLGAGNNSEHLILIQFPSWSNSVVVRVLVSQFFRIDLIHDFFLTPPPPPPCHHMFPLPSEDLSALFSMFQTSWIVILWSGNVDASWTRLSKLLNYQICFKKNCLKNQKKLWTCDVSSLFIPFVGSYSSPAC